MLVRDYIYGELEISSPALCELINSPAVQRLKKICQFGVPDEFYHLKNYSRFDHSVGVMLLLQRLGASEEEQVAGLLHDVSHTAFSHVVDWVVGDGKTEDFQDGQHMRYMERCGLAEILSRHGYDLGRIANYEHFGLLERELPDLCADRVDYALREFTPEVHEELLAALTQINGMIVLKGRKAARLFAELFLERQMFHWGGFEAPSRYRVFADALRLAMEDKIISFEDLWKTDDYVVEKMKQSPNKGILGRLNKLREKSWDSYPRSEIIVHKKFRAVDPLCIEKGVINRLTSIDPEFQKILDLIREQNSMGITLPIIKFN